MEMRRMVRVRQRLLAAEAAAAVVIISLLVLLSTDLASNSGSLSASMAPDLFFAKNSSYGSELQATDSCGFVRRTGDPGTAHAVQSSTSSLSNLTDLHQLLTNDDYIGYQPEGFVCFFLMKKGIKEDIGLDPYNSQTEYSKALTTVDENPYFRSDDHNNTYDMVVDIHGLGFAFPDKTSKVHDVLFVDAILDIAEEYEDSHIVEWWSEDSAHIHVELDTFEPTMETEDDCEACLVQTRNTTVDFTVPYAESYSSSSVAPAHNDSKPLIQWIFLKPLTKELWFATACFVFFTGFVFWMIERSINPVFQGSSLAQFSTALYFVFSTLTFSHGQILRSPLSKIVLVVWCFAVLVLVQSYLATLSSMLAADASTFNGSSAAGPVPLTLGSFSGLFAVIGCISALMLLISLTRSAYDAYTRVRGSESQSTPQNDAANGGSVVPEQPVLEIRDNDSQGAHARSAISRDEEAGGAMQDSMPDASEPVPDVYVQIEMISTNNGVGGAL